jgi:type VI secretion system protein ImpK
LYQPFHELVYRIFTTAWRLRNRLLSGENLELDVEQAGLKAILMSEPEKDLLSDWAGEEVGARPAAGRGTARRQSDFLGARYLLVSWLDEFFTLDTPWAEEWNENKLELQLYGTNDRAWRFWEQAVLAEKRESPAALRAAYLCVMLGFRGELVDQRTKLQGWVDSVLPRIRAAVAASWVSPPRLEPATFVPPLRARERMRRMVSIAGLTLTLALPLAAAFLVFHVSR